MHYDEIKSMLLDEETCQNLIDSHKDCFDKIDEISAYLTQKTTNDPDILRRAIEKLTALFMRLEPIYSMASGKLDIERINLFFKYKNEAEKVANELADKKAKQGIAYLINLVSIFEGYTKSADKAIASCQSILKSLDSGNKTIGYMEG